MSIVLLIRSLGFGGSERQLVELAKGLHQAGHEVVVVAFYAGGPLLAELNQAGVPTRVFQKRGRWDIVSFLIRLGRFLRRQRPDVLYSFLVEPSIVAVMLKPLLNRTKIAWGVRASNLAFGWYDLFARTNFKLSCVLARYADIIIANSWSGAAYHQARRYPARKIAVVPNGIDLARFHPDRRAGGQIRTELGIDEDETVIGIVGRHDPIKGHETCLQAVAMLVPEMPNLRLVCVGDEFPGRTAGLRAQAETLGIASRVSWVRPRLEMTEVYNALDLLCSSSVSEGFPNVLGEAMACGVPCVATDVGDSARVLDGCGTVVPPGDPRALANGMREVLARAGPVLSEACRKRVEREFSIRRMIKETEQLLRKCLDATA